MSQVTCLNFCLKLRAYDGIGFLKTYVIAVTKPSKVIRSTLTWCKNSLLPIVMRQSLAASHFTVVDESTFWVGYWGRHLKSAQYRTIKPYQKVNFTKSDQNFKIFVVQTKIPVFLFAYEEILIEWTGRLSILG